ncbi:alpha/beta fold hydrolase [Segnochrobactrum spirostomi]|uniref:Alpha/beta fold hydrolase n=1 Tax=Segnochrobactrum spirostomi TaxID=2608987 RepID=A0A6A7Y0F2_9HYPH|nr:alpha/beta fold hydrolase [Segnochrobactrum spirostomi]MQT11877.1 alpha/beta fold hydrolase [Segnochrobactrum spirostomi]
MSVTLDRDGLALSLVDQGGEGLPIVFQHGLCGGEGQVAELLPTPAPAPLPPLRRLTLECRGHGASEAGDPARFSIATFADDVAAAVESRGITRAVFGGVSMGAAIATRLAVRRPDLVRALVLLRPAWITEAAPANMAANLEVGRLLAAHAADDARALFEASDTARTLAAEAPDNLASLRGFFTREPIPVTSDLLTAISLDGPGISEAELAALRVPTLVIGQARDLVHPLSHVRRLADLIPGARTVEITPKGEDKPRSLAEFRAVLAEFLLSLPDETAR